MRLRTFIAVSAFGISSFLWAAPSFLSTAQSRIMNQCALQATGEGLDLALVNDGYFVVSSDKKISELSFTRFGKLYIDADRYLRTDSDSYVLAMTKHSGAETLKKIRIPKDNLSPKATTQVKMGLNVPANAAIGSLFAQTFYVYDALSETHALSLHFKKMGDKTWHVTVLGAKDAFLDEGTLTFDKAGKLKRQEGLAQVLWPASYGLQEIKLDFRPHTTEYNGPFYLRSIRTNGHRLGILVTVYVSNHGEIYSLYSNGILKTIATKRIAIARFSHPSLLTPINKYLYKSNEAAGQAMIYWANSEYAVLNGHLETEPCDEAV